MQTDDATLDEATTDDDSVRFEPVDFTRPFSLEEEIARIPSTATVKGVIINAVTDQLSQHGYKAPTSARLFSDYKMHDYMEQCVDVAQTIWPQEPIREGLRRIGHGHYSAFVDTTLGKMVFGVLGRSMERVIRNSPKGYKYTTNCSECRVVQVKGRVAVVEVGGLPFPDSIQVGVYEGGVRATGFESTVRAGLTSTGVVQLQVKWDARSAEPQASGN